MSEVLCEEHGPRPQRFVCQHLTPTSSGLGFVTNPDGDEAWCNACNAVWDEEGEWNARVEQQLSIKLVCDLCYARVRERNA